MIIFGASINFQRVKSKNDSFQTMLGKKFVEFFTIFHRHKLYEVTLLSPEKEYLNCLTIENLKKISNMLVIDNKYSVGFSKGKFWQFY